jgi:methylmalonyl-CoA/ethylmalonyl-CoA epimerase
VKTVRVDHVGIAVDSIEGTRSVYEALGLPVSGKEEIAGQRVIAAFARAGECRLELLEPSAADSPIANFLRKRGPGIHHICLAVHDLDGSLDELAARGFRLIHRRPVPGAGGRRVAFLHPEAGNGVLIELTEDAPAPE